METDEPNSTPKPIQSTSCPKSYSLKSSIKELTQSNHSEGECSKSYSCTKCMDSKQLAKSFATEKRLRQHIQRYHRPHRFKCQVCFKAFSNSSDFHRHQMIHNQGIEKGHKCELCSKILCSKQSLQTHLFGSHGQKSDGVKYFPCKICPSEFWSRSNLERHILGKHVVDKEFECVVCSKKFVDQEALEKHMAKHDKPTQYFCDICSKGFKSTQSIIRHLGIVHQKFFYCIKCKRSYENKSEYDHHSDPKTRSEQILGFHCQICGESLDSQCNFDIHTNCHLAQIKCEKSDDDLLKNDANTKPVRSSIAMPNLTQEFQCELCSKSFDRQTYLTAHRNQVHPNSKWTCSFQQCSKTFKEWNLLKRHKLTHIGTKPFACPLCRKAFYHAKQLEDHKLSHLKDKKHKCEMCRKSFARPSELRVHVANNHGGPKPFECPVKNCGTTWATNFQLKNHSVTHETDRPFKCDMCNTFKAFKSLRQLKRHERDTHLESILIQGGSKLKDKIKPKTMTKYSDALVYICTSNNCSFETGEEKTVALHHNLKHELPRVLISSNGLSSLTVLQETATFETCKRIIQKQYKCSRCLTRFKYQRSLRSHIRKMHNNNGSMVTNN